MTGSQEGRMWLTPEGGTESSQYLNTKQENCVPRELVYANKMNHTWSKDLTGNVKCVPCREDVACSRPWHLPAVPMRHGYQCLWTHKAWTHRHVSDLRSLLYDIPYEIIKTKEKLSVDLGFWLKTWRIVNFLRFGDVKDEVRTAHTQVRQRERQINAQ